MSLPASTPSPIASSWSISASRASSPKAIRAYCATPATIHGCASSSGAKRKRRRLRNELSRSFALQRDPHPQPLSRWKRGTSCAPAARRFAMSAQANNFKLGLFVIGATVALVLLLLIVGSGRWFQSKTIIETYFNESVQGLDIGSKVKYRGVSVGEVTRIGFTYN